MILNRNMKWVDVNVQSKIIWMNFYWWAKYHWTIKKEEQAKEDLKTSAKAKLIAGEPLTEEEADTIVL